VGKEGFKLQATLPGSRPVNHGFRRGCRSNQSLLTGRTPHSLYLSTLLSWFSCSRLTSMDIAS